MPFRCTSRKTIECDEGWAWPLLLMIGEGYGNIHMTEAYERARKGGRPAVRNNSAIAHVPAMAAKLQYTYYSVCQAARRSP